jgi:hypothetical protein
MKTRLRSAGIGGAIATLLATGALLLPAAPAAQARPSEGSCQVLASVIDLAIANNQIWYAFEKELEGILIGCWQLRARRGGAYDMRPEQRICWVRSPTCLDSMEGGAK